MENFNQIANANQKDDDEIVIDLGRILFELKKYWKFIIGTAVVCGLIMLIVSAFIMTPMYESKAKVYLKPEMREDSTGIDSSSISANAMMVNNYMVMMKGDTLMKKVANTVEKEYAAQTKEEEINLSKDYVKNVLTVSNEVNTEIITLSAVTEDPALSQMIVKHTLDEFSVQVKGALNVKNILVIDKASKSKKPVSPSISKNTVLGVIAGLIIALGLIAIKVITDKRLRTKEETESYLGIPVLASIPYREA